MTRIYLDTSAVIKRVFDEAESTALGREIEAAAEVGAHLITSALTRVETSRVARTRIDADAPRLVAKAAADALAGIAVAQLNQAVLESARIIGPPLLRTLDALHLATAVAVAADEVWTDDERMARTSEELGIPARAPGRDPIGA